MTWVMPGESVTTTDQLPKGDARDLGALIVAIAPSIKAEVPCPVCQARRSGGAARA